MRRRVLALFGCLACTPTETSSDPPNEARPDPNAEQPMFVEQPPTDAADRLPVDPESQGPPAATPIAFKPTSTPFGGKVWGFVQASSSNGRIVLIRQFGADEPGQFGHHGPSPGAAVLIAHDLERSDSQQVELVDMDPSRRWFLLRNHDSLWLLDSGTGSWEALAGADLQDDGNACLMSRSGKFSQFGNRLGWIREGARQFRVRDLASGREWSVPSQGRIWVGWPLDADDGAVLAELDAGTTDWPQQQTSCSCWWCNRFARSYGFYGWHGPSFEFHQVSRTGERSSGNAPEIGFDVHGKTPDGCELVATASSTVHGDLLDLGPWRWKCP